MPPKRYVELTHIAGKEIRAILKQILAVFTSSLHTNTDTTCPTVARQREFPRVMEYVQYLTHYAQLLAYDSHSESTVQYIQDSIQWF